MSKHIVSGFITYEKASYQTSPTINFQTYRPSAEYSPNTVIVAEHAIEVEVPDDFNPIAPMVAALQEQKRLARLELAAKLKAIDTRISQLTCIEHVIDAAQTEAYAEGRKDEAEARQ